jgi:hypothetical protein
MNPEPHIPRETAHKLARRTLFGFLVTFMVSKSICLILGYSEKDVVW